MNKTYEKLVGWLFETKAVRVCPQDKPFWYTSGTIGPYYINTHFLYGSETKANELLGLIDIEKENKRTSPGKILEATLENYDKDPIYKGLMDEMCLYVRDKVDIDSVNFISGGERRDWFFSYAAAELLNKPHVTIYKDLSVMVTKGGHPEEASKLAGMKVLHIADLITEASSYERAWIPAIRQNGGEIRWSVVVVDRKQGGEALLSREGIQSHAMVSIDKSLFEKALSMDLISIEQFGMISGYLEDPKESMRNFLIEHPEFLRNSLVSDEKTKERAKLLLEKNFYSLEK